MRFVLAVLCSGIAAVAAQGCGPSCETSAPNNWKVCPNDPNPTANDVAKCKAAQMGPCSGKYNDYVSCVQEKIKCDPTTKQSDPESKLNARQACETGDQSKLAIYLACAQPTM